MGTKKDLLKLIFQSSGGGKSLQNVLEPAEPAPGFRGPSSELEIIGRLEEIFLFITWQKR